MTLPLLADAGFCSLCLGGKLADRDERTVPMRLTRNVCWGWKIKNRSKFRGLLNRPQRERLPRFQVGILMIGKVEPTVTIRAELRLLFHEIQFYRIYLGGFRIPSRLLDIDRPTYRRIGLLRGVVSLGLA
jgi:hypothetical protein